MHHMSDPSSCALLSIPPSFLCFFFFFQAEDGIRDADVTGVQTCALPIYVIPKNTNPYGPKTRIAVTSGWNGGRFNFTSQATAAAAKAALHSLITNPLSRPV